LENGITIALVPFSDAQVFHYSIQGGVTARNEAVVFSMGSRGDLATEGLHIRAVTMADRLLKPSESMEIGSRCEWM
jgi:hypothetical protein